MIDKAKIYADLASYFRRILHRDYSRYSTWYREELEIEFLKELDEKLNHALLTYKPPPQINKSFSYTEDFINKSISSGWLYRHCKTTAFKNTQKQLQQVQWKDTYDTQLEAREMSDPAKQLDRDELQKRVEKQLDNFSTYLTPYELVIFNEMRHAATQNKHTVDEIIEYLQAAGYGEQSENMIRRVRNILEFRLACLTAHPSVDLFSETVTLSTLNKLGRAKVKGRKGYNLRFFGIDRLQSVPDADRLMYVAAGKFKRDRGAEGPVDDEVVIAVMAHDRNAVKTEGKPYIYSSKIDLNGIKHDHSVVYIDRTGNAYDHVTKRTTRLV